MCFSISYTIHYDIIQYSRIERTFTEISLLTGATLLVAFS